MRNLVNEKKWLLNLPKSRLWQSKEGLFVIWKSAAKEIIDQIGSLGFEGVPNNYVTLAEILVESKIAERNRDSLFYMLKPEDGSDFYHALKIRDPLILLEENSNSLATVEFKDFAIPADEKPKRKPRAAPKAQQIKEEIEQESTPEPINTPASSVIKKPGVKPINDDQLELPGLMPEKIQSQLDFVDDTHASDTSSENVEVATTRPPVAEKPKSLNSSVEKKNKISVDQAEIKHIEPDETNTSSFLTERGKKVIRSDMHEVIEQMICDYRGGEHDSLIFDSPTGVAFDLVQILKYGVALDKLLGIFTQNGWLDSPAENLNRKYLQLINPIGNKTKCVVIKYDAAKLIGFSDES